MTDFRNPRNKVGAAIGYTGFIASARCFTNLRSVIAGAVKGCRSLMLIPAMAMTIGLAACATTDSPVQTAQVASSTTSQVKNYNTEWTELTDMPIPSNVRVQLICRSQAAMLSLMDAAVAGDDQTGSMLLGELAATGECGLLQSPVIAKVTSVLRVGKRVNTNVYFAVVSIVNPDGSDSTEFFSGLTYEDTSVQA
jgi:hypothetical protein